MLEVRFDVIAVFLKVLQDPILVLRRMRSVAALPDRVARDLSDATINLERGRGHHGHEASTTEETDHDEMGQS